MSCDKYFSNRVLTGVSFSYIIVCVSKQPGANGLNNGDFQSHRDGCEQCVCGVVDMVSLSLYTCQRVTFKIQLIYSYFFSAQY